MHGRLDEMLAVVEDQQQLFAFERASEVLDRIAFRGKRCTLSADATVVGMYSPFFSGALSSINQTPSPEPSSSSAATCKERRVLPTPPEPTSVTRRCCSISAVISAISISRPTAGRMPRLQVVGEVFEASAAAESRRSNRVQAAGGYVRAA